jgi:MFS family permease
MGDKRKSPFFYGWVVVSICFLTVAISYGIRYSFPVFYASILSEFGWSRADTALIFSINIIVYGISAPIAGVAVDRLGPRKFMTMGAILLAVATAACSLTHQIWHFYVLFGVLASFGICATGNVPNATLVSHWFVKRRGTAFGIFNTGFAVAYAMAYGIEYAIRQINWRSSFLLLGFLAAATAPLIGIFQRLDPRDKGLLPDGEPQSTAGERVNAVNADALVIDKQWASKQWDLPKAIKTYRFWLLFATHLFLWGIAINLMLTHQVVFVVDQGYSRAFGALIFSLYGVFYGLGNLLGFLSDRFGREITATVGLTLAALGTLMLILNRGDYTPWFMYAYGVLFGIGIGITSPALSASVADLFQGKNFGSIIGLIVMGFGIGGSISPWLGGRIFDLLGTYVPAFYLVMAAIAVSAVCLWIASPRRVRLVPGKSPRLARKLRAPE